MSFFLKNPVGRTYSLRLLALVIFFLFASLALVSQNFYLAWIALPLFVLVGLLIGQQKCPRCGYEVIKTTKGNYTLGHHRKCQKCGFELINLHKKQGEFGPGDFGFKSLFLSLKKLLKEGIQYKSFYWRNMFKLVTIMVLFFIVSLLTMFNYVKIYVLVIVFVLLAIPLGITKCPECKNKQKDIHNILSKAVIKCPYCNFDFTKNYSKTDFNEP